MYLFIVCFFVLIFLFVCCIYYLLKAVGLIDRRVSGGRRIKGSRWKFFWVFFVVFCLVVSVGVVFFVFSVFKLSSLPVIGQKVAVIPLKGEITAEGCSGGLFGAPSCVSVSAVKNMLKEADADSSVRAIVLDIDSGGGAVVPSRELARAVKNTRKPVVACIRGIGASGAYYVASAADHIVADRDSITGSIGVIMTVTHTYGLYEKLGINVTTIKAGKTKDIGSPNRPMTDEEVEELSRMVSKIHRDFIYDVAVNRNMTYDYAESIADGSIFLGSEAKELGLVDSLGDIDDAIRIAGRLGNISGEPSVDKKEVKEFNFWDLLSGY